MHTHSHIQTNDTHNTNDSHTTHALKHTSTHSYYQTLAHVGVLHCKEKQSIEASNMSKEFHQQQTADSSSRQQTADSRQQTADSRQQTADSRQQTADSRQQTTDNRQQTTYNRQQTTDNRQHTTYQLKLPKEVLSKCFLSVLVYTRKCNLSVSEKSCMQKEVNQML